MPFSMSSLDAPSRLLVQSWTCNSPDFTANSGPSGLLYTRPCLLASKIPEKWNTFQFSLCLTKLFCRKKGFHLCVIVSYAQDRQVQENLPTKGREQPQKLRLKSQKGIHFKCSISKRERRRQYKRRNIVKCIKGRKRLLKFHIISFSPSEGKTENSENRSNPHYCSCGPLSISPFPSPSIAVHSTVLDLGSSPLLIIFNILKELLLLFKGSRFLP